MLGLQLPAFFSVELKPHRVARAVIGHLLAAEERKDPAGPIRRGPMPDDMRAYFLDPEAAAPSTLELYVWPYAGETHLIARALSITRYGASDSAFGSILKFNPLAFWLVYERSETTQINVPMIPIHDCAGLDSDAVVTLPVRNCPRPDWPEKPDEWGIVLLNNESTIRIKPAPLR